MPKKPKAEVKPTEEFVNTGMVNNEPYDIMPKSTVVSEWACPVCGTLSPSVNGRAECPVDGYRVQDAT